MTVVACPPDATPRLTDVDLAHYTDSPTMQALLQARLPGFADGSLVIEWLRVGAIRRNTSLQRNPLRMSLAYHLGVRHTASGRVGEQRLHAEVYRGEEAAAVAAGQDQAALQPPAHGAAFVCLPDWQLLLWALPNDPGLPQLALLLDPCRLGAHLPMAGTVSDVELLRHEPRQRATLRYRWHAPDGASRTVFAKTFRDDRAAAIDERFRWFWSEAARDATAPLVAEPLGWDPVTRSVWQAPAQGVPLHELLSTGAAPAVLAQVAAALARLHAAPLAHTVTAPARTATHWLAEVRRRSHKLERIDAGLAARARAVAAGIEAQAAHALRRPATLIHGDCHPDQVWVQGPRVLLFDFDEFTLGDPMEDLAEFVLKLEQAGVGPALVEGFVAACARADAAHFDRPSLDWHLAIQALLQASRAFIYQQVGWADTVERRLAACEARVAVLGRAVR